VINAANDAGASRYVNIRDLVATQCNGLKIGRASGADFGTEEYKVVGPSIRRSIQLTAD
jgi:hypothetical protein